MYGKFFSSTFTGSMYGAGPTVFAVWGYVIANAVDSAIELNPIMLAGVLGTNKEDIASAISFLCSPDPQSRNPEEDGRRLVKEGAFQYRVISHELYRKITAEDERREYNRVTQRRFRAKRDMERMSQRLRQQKSRQHKQSKEVASANKNVNDSQQTSAMSAHTEADTEADTEAEAEVQTAVVVPAVDTSPKSSYTPNLARPQPRSSRVDPANAVYLAYPRKVGKGKALPAIRRAFDKLARGECDGQVMTQRQAQEWLYRKVMAYAGTPAGRAGSLTPHPTTWFNQARYLDDPKEWQIAGGSNGKTGNDCGGAVGRVARSQAAFRAAGEASIAREQAADRDAAGANGGGLPPPGDESGDGRDVADGVRGPDGDLWPRAGAIGITRVPNPAKVFPPPRGSGRGA